MPYSFTLEPLVARAKDNANSEPALELRLVGPFEVWRGDARQPLPRSKKTRALLAYLAVTGRPHSRNRLCDLFWDVTDDRRGALRWSLSRLRKVVDDGTPRIDADREQVSFAASGVRIDALELEAIVKRGVGDAASEELEELASRARGEFLEGLELPDFFEFQAWCVDWRERCREARSEILAELVRRSREEPRRALAFARSRVQADSLNVAAAIDLLEILVASGKADEARTQLEMSCRLFREVGATGAQELESAWRNLISLASADRSAADDQPDRSGARPLPEPPALAASHRTPFVGRNAEVDRLSSLLDDTRARGNQRIAVITGEPGAGKSRLAESLIARARECGMATLTSRAFEGESSRPYGPWVDALGKELGDLSAASSGAGTASREELFSAIADFAATTAAQHDGALLVLDDIQWLDRDSAELLHFVARTNRQRPICVLLLARSGELADNEHALRALRSLRREMQLEEISLEPLSRQDVEDLISAYSDIDAAKIYEACAGNPLYALELARSWKADSQQPPASLIDLVRERVDQIPTSAADLLRWCAVLGHAVDLSRLHSLSSLQPEELIHALERLEQHELLRTREDGGQVRYAFAHDVVRQSVYGELSQPRRRLMHQQVARLLEADATRPEVATEVAYHASLAGDAMLAVRACITAGRQALRVFANGDAETLARRGLRFVDEITGSERTSATLELLHVQFSARTPDEEQAAARLRALTEEALDAGMTTPARLGFQMLSFLRWETGSMMAAHDNIMRAERISRSEDPAQRMTALSQAAKCLLLLERDMPLAESFLLEADALSNRSGSSPSALHFANGMMCERRGELDEAAAAYSVARLLGQQQGDRLAEFCAIEQLMMLALDRRDDERALELARDLSELGERVRAGAEAACARALYALVQRYAGDESTEPALRQALEDLRAADSKYRLSYVLTRYAQLELERGDQRAAAELARDALAVATDIGRASEIAIAHALLAQCAQDAGDAEAVRGHCEALVELQGRELSALARRQLESAIEDRFAGTSA